MCCRTSAMRLKASQTVQDENPRRPQSRQKRRSCSCHASSAGGQSSGKCSRRFCYIDPGHRAASAKKLHHRNETSLSSLSAEYDMFRHAAQPLQSVLERHFWVFWHVCWHPGRIRIRCGGPAPTTCGPAQRSFVTLTKITDGRFSAHGSLGLRLYLSLRLLHTECWQNQFPFADGHLVPRWGDVLCPFSRPCRAPFTFACPGKQPTFLDGGD